jgi:hypothetical protein
MQEKVMEEEACARSNGQGVAGSAWKATFWLRVSAHYESMYNRVISHSMACWNPFRN